MSLSGTIKAIQDIMRKDAGVDGDAQRISQLGWLFFLKVLDDREHELELLDAKYKSPVPKHLRWRNWAADAEGITGEKLLDFVNNELFRTLKTLPVTESDPRTIVVRSVFEDAFNYMKNGTLLRQVINRINQDIDLTKAKNRHFFGDIYEQILRDLQSAGNAGEYYTPRPVTQIMVELVDPKLGERVLDPACGTGGFLTCTLEHVRKRYVKKPADEQKLQQCLTGVEKKPLPHLLCTTNMLLHGMDVPSNIRHDNTLARPLRDYGQKDKVDIVLTNPPFGGKEEDGIEINFPTAVRTRETADLFLVLIAHLLKDGGRAAVVLPDGVLFGEGVETRIKEKLLTECNLHTIVRLPHNVFAPYTSYKTNLLFFEKGAPTKEIWFYEHKYPPGLKSYSMTKPLRYEEFEPLKAWWKSRAESNLAWRVSIDEVRARGYNLDFENPNADEKQIGNPDELSEDVRALDAEIASLSVSIATALRSVNGQERLLVGLPNLVEHQKGPERLRQHIRSLAVRGLIGVPPARAFSAGGPFSLPDQWRWAKVADMAKARLGKMLDKAKNKGEPHRYLRNVNVRWFDFDLSDVHEMKFENRELDEFSLKQGDVLVCEGGEPGRAAVWDEREPGMRFQKAIHRLRFNEEVDPTFFVIALREAASSGRLDQYCTGAGIQHLTGKGLAAFEFPVPPRDQQEVIVSTVQALTEKCDRLESVLKARERKRSELMEAVCMTSLDS